MKRVVFDCVVFLQAALREQSPAGACLDLALAFDVELVISAQVVKELIYILNRSDIRRKFKQLTDQRVKQIINEVTQMAHYVSDVPERYVLRRDTKDSAYINLALAANAWYLVTRDNDLLDLMDESRPESVDFRRQFPDLQIIDPVELLRIVRHEKQSMNN